MEIQAAKKRKFNPSSYMPQHMVEAILSKLPVKSLVRFMSVSQSWNSLITNPSFSLLRSNFAHNVLVLNPDFELLTIDHASNSLITLNFPFNRPHMQIIGSCNGLVCISLTGDYENMIVWNPCTGIFRELPNPSCPKDSIYYSYGFGYDSLSKDFKILLAVEEYADDSQSVFYYVEVFSLKQNSWKRIRYSINPQESIVGEPSYRMRGTHLNGVLYWNLHELVHVFDLGSENFSTLPSPGSDGYLGVLDNCLSLSAFTGIWILKCCGVANSWDKFVSLSTEDDIRPLYMMNNDIIAKKFVEERGEEIAGITVPSGKISTLFKIGDGQNMCDAIAYVEDLVSPSNFISEIEDVNTEKRVI
ncbi:F-box/kelch-repeat protein At3g23880-like [Mercurialis annua]|uniref:F-box/kelch-repeat protein At3g23880-like n=1 Tax=Mercurialis annua TaxID=3986 RepID=UPI00215F27AB|nr:F-box/kelch-repeat protein At3g23880-like [Mercurialis annua]